MHQPTFATVLTVSVGGGRGRMGRGAGVVGTVEGCAESAPPGSLATAAGGGDAVMEEAVSRPLLWAYEAYGGVLFLPMLAMLCVLGVMSLLLGGALEFGAVAAVAWLVLAVWMFLLAAVMDFWNWITGGRFLRDRAWSMTEEEVAELAESLETAEDGEWEGKE